MLDSTGVGQGVAGFSNNVYNFTMAGHKWSSSGNSVSIAASDDTRHVRLALKKVGTNYSGRGSVDGLTMTVFNTANANACTPAVMGTIRIYNGGSTVWETIHRFNGYPAPTFFPG